MGFAYQLRSMTPEDLRLVLDLEQRCHLHPWSEKTFLQELENKCSAVDLLWSDTQLAGYIVSWLVAGELEVQNVVTAPEFRRKGVARLLLHHVMARSARQGASRVLLEVRSDNVPAITLYKELGLKINGQRENYYSNGDTALLMCLDDLSSIKFES